MRTNFRKAIFFAAAVMLANTVNVNAQSTTSGAAGNTYSSSSFLGWGATSGDLLFKVNNGTKMLIQNTTGYVGVGTTTPYAPLNVAGTNANPTASMPANGALFVGSTATGLALTMGVFSNGGTNPLSWIQSRNQTVASTYYSLSLNPLGGNVNIGTFTVTPTNKLAVSGDIGWGAGAVTSALSNDQGGSLELGGTNSAKNPLTNGTPYLDFHFGTGAVQDFNMRIINSANNRLDFAQSSNVSVMTLNGPNVGIGTSLPIQTLDVTGRINISNGVIQKGGSTITSTSDLGLYSQTSGSWVRFVTNGGAFKFFSDAATNPIGSAQLFSIENDGKVVIGNVNIVGDYKLYVQTGILTEKVKVAVATTSNWSDYVFGGDYKLKSLNEVEAYVKENKHLPNIPSAQEVVKNGVDLGAMDAKLLEKIEELTLYMIDMKKENEAQKARIAEMEIGMNKLSK